MRRGNKLWVIERAGALDENWAGYDPIYKCVVCAPDPDAARLVAASATRPLAIEAQQTRADRNPYLNPLATSCMPLEARDEVGLVAKQQDADEASVD